MNARKTETAKTLSEMIVSRAKRFGFCAAGISTVHDRSTDMERLRNMIGENRHGDMRYLERCQDERKNPGALLPGAKSLITAALPYAGDSSPGKSGISSYALGEDYHRTVRARFEQLLDFIREIHHGEVNAKILVDSGPLFEKSWAEEAGIGRMGKNTLLIVPGAGSYVFLGELLLDIELESTEGGKLSDPCGDCDACLRHCPNGALVGPGKLDARRCISYLTVEHKGEFTPGESRLTDKWLFGCDICQKVCPHNKPENRKACTPETTLSEKLRDLEPETVLSMTGSGFKTFFGGTPVFRTGLKRLKRNARAVLGNGEKVKNQK